MVSYGFGTLWENYKLNNFTKIIQVLFFEKRWEWQRQLHSIKLIQYFPIVWIIMKPRNPLRMLNSLKTFCVIKYRYMAVVGIYNQNMYIMYVSSLPSSESFAKLNKFYKFQLKSMTWTSYIIFMYIEPYSFGVMILLEIF